MNEPEDRSTHLAGAESDAQLAVTESAAPQAAQPTRRAVIASIAGLVGAALAKAVTRPGEALAACDPLAAPLVADCPTVVSGTTQLDRSQATGVTGPVFQVDAGEFTAIHGNAPHGVGVVGVSGPISAIGGVATPTLTYDMRAGGAFLADNGSGVVGVHAPFEFSAATLTYLSSTPSGVTGVASTSGAGVIGLAIAATGTVSDLRLNSGGGGIGVLGLQGQISDIFGATSTSGFLDGAVVGMTAQGTGVFGGTVTATGTGVLAYNSSGGFALRVAGAAAFSTIGEGLIPPLTLDHDVQDPNVSVNSHIMVTFTSPAKKLFISWVEIVEGFGFRLHLSKKQKVPVSFTYLVLERAA